MADFVAVIKRAVDGLAEQSPATRERVYDKARTAVRRQLENMSPRPTDEAIAGQLAKLEDAILAVEAERAVASDLDEPAEAQEAPPAPAAEDIPAAPPPAPAPPTEEPHAETGDDRNEATKAAETPVEPPVEPPVERPVEQQAEPPLAPHADETPDAGPAAESAGPPPAQQPLDELEDAASEEDAAAPQEAPETPAGKSGPAPVPFGSYAIGRAHAFSAPAREEPPAKRPESETGFTPSRYQDGFRNRLHIAPVDDDVPPEGVSANGELVPSPEPIDAVEMREEAPDGLQNGREDEPAAEIVAATHLEEGGGDGARPGENDGDALGRWLEDEATATGAGAGREGEPTAGTQEEGREQPHEPAAGALAGKPADEAKAPRHGEPSDDDVVFGGLADRLAARRQAGEQNAGKSRGDGGRGRKIAVALIVLIVLAGVGIAGYANRDRLVALFSPEDGATPPAQEQAAGEPPAAEEQPVAGDDQDVAEVTPDEPPAEDEAAPAEPDEGQAADAASGEEPGAEGIEKFTQRLLADGSEVQEGPARPVSDDTQDEGRSVALQSEGEAAGEDDASQPGAAQPEASEEEPISPEQIADSEAAENAPAEEAEAAAQPADGPAVGETMFLYEERLGQRGPSALEGNVAWSVVNESPGGDAPAEEAIRAEVTVPEKDLTALVTIRRNTDPSLPASHLIEIVFSLPATFEGGGIESVQRVAFKQTEEARGSELIAVPARITDDFFMVALNDYAEAVEANLDLMRERDWIDIPIVYGNGRRALLTLQKGSTGVDAFDRVISIWERQANGSAG